MSQFCALCGAAAPAPFRASPPELAPDLDQRPGEPTRSTLKRWLQTCRTCGACAPNLAALPPGREAVTHSPAYAEQPSRFLRWAMLVAGTQDEAEALLQAAWEADDAGSDAAVLRRRAALVWQDTESVGSMLRLVDVLRRAAAFDEAAVWLNKLPPQLDEISGQIARFQRGRVVARDATRQLISSALAPPARRPHVAHGKPKGGGFWARLRGG